MRFGMNGSQGTILKPRSSIRAKDPPSQPDPHHQNLVEGLRSLLVMAGRRCNTCAGSGRERLVNAPSTQEEGIGRLYCNICLQYFSASLQIS